MDDAQNEQHNAQVAAIAAAYLGNPSTKIEKTDLADVIRQIDLGLRPPAPATAVAEPETERPNAAAVRKSITPDALISFVDGKPYKSLKRHLASNGLTPKQYREQFGLKADYPMTAPAYSAHRSELAKRSGLGQLAAKRREASLAATTTAPAAIPEAPRAQAVVAAKPRGRPKAVKATPSVALPEISKLELEAASPPVGAPDLPNPKVRRKSAKETPSAAALEPILTPLKAAFAKGPKAAKPKSLAAPKPRGTKAVATVIDAQPDAATSPSEPAPPAAKIPRPRKSAEPKPKTSKLRRKVAS